MEISINFKTILRKLMRVKCPIKKLDVISNFDSKDIPIGYIPGTFVKLEKQFKEVIKVNIPEKVKIGYKDYKITKVDNKFVSEDDKVCYGDIEFDKGNINIATIYDEDQQKCTLIHECLHGIDNMVEADLTEDQVRLIAKGLYDFIKSNPQLFIDSDNNTIVKTREWCNGSKEITININNGENIEEVVEKIKNTLIKQDLINGR